MSSFEHLNTCSICLALIDKESTAKELQCGHKFHAICIKNWEEAVRREHAERLCPNCRHPIAYKAVQDLLEINIVVAPARVLPDSKAMQPGSPPNNNPNPLHRNQRRLDICSIVGLVILFLIAMGAYGAMLYFFIQIFTDLVSGEYPVFSAGMTAKGFIAVGMFAEGILTFGMVGQGLISFSMVGYGLVFFVGQIGGGMGFAIYQVGLSWYCYVGQLSIGVWFTRKAQAGFSIIGPLVDSSKKHTANCED